MNMSGPFADPEPNTVCVACSHNGQRRQSPASTLIRSSGPDGCFAGFDFDLDFITPPHSRRLQ
jgi:hypothetical protein